MESCPAIQAGISTEQAVITGSGNYYLVEQDGQFMPLTQDNIQDCLAAYDGGLGHLTDTNDFAYNAPDVADDVSRNFQDFDKRHETL